MKEIISNPEPREEEPKEQPKHKEPPKVEKKPENVYQPGEQLTLF